MSFSNSKPSSGSSTLNSPQSRADELVQGFSNLKTWEDKYKAIIEKGRALEVFPDDLRKEENLVKGCQSQVWLVASLMPNGNIELRGDSDALIVKGLVAILLKIYSDSSPQEILQTPADFIGEIGFSENLSPSRSNGLFSMIKQIRNYAIAFDYILKSQP